MNKPTSLLNGPNLYSKNHTTETDFAQPLSQLNALKDLIKDPFLLTKHYHSEKEDYTINFKI